VRLQTLLAVAGSLLSLAGLSATAVLTMQQFRNGAVSAGSLVMAFRAVQSMPAYAGGVVRSWGMALENSMYMGRLRRLVSTVGETSASHGALELEAPLKTIELSAVSFRYPGADRLALGGVNLTLRRGESVALVGLNGAGKTTLAKLLLGLYRPSEGQILYDGRSVSEYDLGSLRRRMGCLFQDFVKYLLTVRDNVAFGAESEPEDCVIQRAIEQAGATDLVQSAGGLDAQLGKQFGGTDLSGGEWQKLALARALIRDVDFLVLDEPSASLDADAEYEVYVRFKEMAGDRICLLISHRFTTVSIADRIVVLSDGRIVEEGSHSELMDRAGVYARMYRMQAEQYWKEQADRHASGQAGKHVDRSADKHANGPAGKYADRPADKHANGPAGENSRTHVGQRSKEGGSG